MRQLKYLCRRKRQFLFVAVMASTIIGLGGLRWTVEVGKKVLIPPPPLEHDFRHFESSRSLKYYMDNIQVLVEPSSTKCRGIEEVPVVILVTTSPSHVEQRDAIRKTWGGHQPTFFILGHYGPEFDENFVDNYLEAKQHRDMIIFDLQEHYQNLTLKTAVMLQWAVDRCPQAEFVLKTDDDVFVNPWMMPRILKENENSKLLGYKIIDASFHRDAYNKWYVPRWLYWENRIPEYLSGTGYFIRGEYIKKILDAAKSIPLINLEDIYFTYLVAKKQLKLDLTHDRRISPYKPWIGSGCAYWALLSVHSLSPEEIVHAWRKLEQVAKGFETNKNICKYFEFLSKDLFLYPIFKG